MYPPTRKTCTKAYLSFPSQGSTLACADLLCVSGMTPALLACINLVSELPVRFSALCFLSCNVSKFWGCFLVMLALLALLNGFSQFIHSFVRSLIN